MPLARRLHWNLAPNARAMCLVIRTSPDCRQYLGFLLRRTGGAYSSHTGSDRRLGQGGVCSSSGAKAQERSNLCSGSAFGCFLLGQVASLALRCRKACNSKLDSMPSWRSVVGKARRFGPLTWLGNMACVTVLSQEKMQDHEGELSWWWWWWPFPSVEQPTQKELMLNAPSHERGQNRGSCPLK